MRGLGILENAINSNMNSVTEKVQNKEAHGRTRSTVTPAVQTISSLTVAAKRRRSGCTLSHLRNRVAFLFISVNPITIFSP